MGALFLVHRHDRGRRGGYRHRRRRLRRLMSARCITFRHQTEPMVSLNGAQSRQISRQNIPRTEILSLLLAVVVVFVVVVCLRRERVDRRPAPRCRWRSSGQRPRRWTPASRRGGRARSRRPCLHRRPRPCGCGDTTRGGNFALLTVVFAAAAAADVDDDDDDDDVVAASQSARPMSRQNGEPRDRFSLARSPGKGGELRPGHPPENDPLRIAYLTRQRAKSSPPSLLLRLDHDGYGARGHRRLPGQVNVQANLRSSIYALKQQHECGRSPIPLSPHPKS